MGLVFVMAVITALIGVIYLFVHAVRADPSTERHRWLAVVPLMIIFGWILEQLLVGNS